MWNIVIDFGLRRRFPKNGILAQDLDSQNDAVPLNRRRRACRLALLASVAAMLVAGPCAGLASAQLRIDFGPRRFEAEAVAGQPFGVGRIVVDLPPEMLPQPLGVEGIGLSEAHGRVLYPAADSPAFGKVVKGVLDRGTPLTTGGPVREEVSGLLRGILDRPPRATIYFLFRGAEPLDLSIRARSDIPVKIVPRGDANAHQRLLGLWWQQYAKSPRLLETKPDYPPLVDNYLITTLARRLNLQLPKAKQTKSAQTELRKELGVNLGTEELRVDMAQDRILGLNNLDQPADQPLPEALSPPELEVPELAADVKVDPIAMRVPAECFYVRFGSFANFLWLQDTLAQWGGDAQNLIALRGLDRGMSGRIEKQLVLKQTALSRMLGSTVISDVAIIGADMFFREGAAYGILFHARNNLGLSASLTQQRSERLGQGGVKEEKVKFGDRTVSYLMSPDGSVRSYYVVDGDFHFVTTSRRLVERFLATASGEGALGASKEFRHARSVMPLSRDDTVWVYLSDAFFRNITGPHYRVEMARRLQATADIELVQLAKLAAAAENRPGDTMDALIAAGLLPPDFETLPYGSRAVIEKGTVHDSIRGYHGSFMPIPDMPVDKITQSELAEYQRFCDFYREQWQRIDPIVVGMKRTSRPHNQEHVVVDVLMTPFAPQHFTLLQKWTGPADNDRLAAIPGDIANLQWVASNQRIFAGLRDIGPKGGSAISGNPEFARLTTLGRFRSLLEGYIGTTGELGLLSFLNIGIPPAADAAGYAMSPVGGWRRQNDQFTVFSFQREILETVVPQLRFEKAERPAQLRLQIGDVSRARITPTLNDLAYARTRESSLNNLRLMHALDQQLHVPPAACKEAAEFLLDAKLICPLGGKYELRESPGSAARWTSTSLERQATAGTLRDHAPEGYVSPPLNWFRGLDLDAAMNHQTISIHAEIDMQMPGGQP